MRRGEGTARARFVTSADNCAGAAGAEPQRDVANNLLISLSGSAQVTPTVWLNPATGVSYTIATQTPQHKIEMQPIPDAATKDLPRGSQVVVRGTVETMTSWFVRLVAGLALAIVLVYLLTRRMTAMVLLLKGRGGDWRAARLSTLAPPD
jgi:hypothetical protein